MLRAVVLAARLEFTIDEPILECDRGCTRHEIARSAPARLVEEFYKILRSGHAEDAMRQLRATGLLKEITPELAAAPDAVFGASIAALDRYRSRFASAPESLTNAILAGTLLHPLGLLRPPQRFAADPLERRLELGMLPIAAPRRRAAAADARAAAAAARHRRPRRARSGRCCTAPSLEEALTWLEIHGDARTSSRTGASSRRRRTHRRRRRSRVTAEAQPFRRRRAAAVAARRSPRSRSGRVSWVG